MGEEKDSFEGVVGEVRRLIMWIVACGLVGLGVWGG